MNFIKIKPGSFFMGSPESEPGRFSDEIQKEVVIDKEFEIMDAPVTQVEWVEIMRENPSCFVGQNKPVENVSFNENVPIRIAAQKEFGC